ncbi:hypothetical protein K438DRAFT_2124148 [Mycena galopus ATCC 62051]|nr:hypothetical protein K438DRAFT_2124148 [Mycena galopus ATCC 62051]
MYSLPALSPACCALTKLGLADKYEGVVEANGTLKLTEVFDEANTPFPKPSSMLNPRSSTHRDSQKYIFGGPVVEYMGSAEDKCFKKQFASYLAYNIGSEDIDIYLRAHAAIREDLVKPTDKSKHWKSRSAKNRPKRLAYAERKQNIATKIEKFKAVTQLR